MASVPPLSQETIPEENEESELTLCLNNIVFEENNHKMPVTVQKKCLMDLLWVSGVAIAVKGNPTKWIN